jgi:RNA polymerase sigma-70 factor (ECF subfamily)
MARRYDSDLVTRLQRRDEEAFTSLVLQHHAALRRTALAFVSTSASAEEVVQDTWLAVLDGLSTFEGRSQIKTWIFQILINRARTRGSREARSMPVSAMSCQHEAGPAPERVDESNTPTQLLLRKELGAAIDAAVRDLPERWRAVVVLRDALGWSPEDVCNALAVNETNQRVLLHRARGRLRASLEHYKAAG